MKITRFRRKQSLWARTKGLFIKKQKKRFKFWKFLLVSSIILGGGLFIYSSFFLPDVRNAEQLNFAESTIIYDRNALDEIRRDPNADLTKNILYTIHGDENRDYIPLSEISPWMIKATVAIEDERFYRHFGFDIFGLVNAVLGQIGIIPSRGGSTITQQLVKNTFLTREKTFTRKFKEILLAIKMEWHYSKDEILELYLNKIPYGSNAHGIEAASKTFFGKSSRDLTLSESVILAGLPQAPSRFNPYGSKRDLLMGYYDYEEDTGERIWKKGRKDLVLKSMLDQKKISYKEFARAFGDAKDLEFKRAQGDIGAPHFVFFIMEKLEEKYGKDFLRQGGLRIFTTIDHDLQELAETTIKEKSSHYLDTYGASNVALLSIKNETGEILSYVGGKNFNDIENDGQVDVLTSSRQPGSSFKPFVYATAFEKGYSPASVLFDVETDFGGNYRPQNFDGKFRGPISARSALNSSLNVPAVKMAYLAGLDNIINFTKKIGIKLNGDSKQNGLSLGLGVGEVTPLSHINAYQVFAGDGSYYEPTAILEIRNSEGKILESADLKSKKRDGIDPQIAALVRNILTDETTRPTTDGFDWNKLLQLKGINNGAKTGTSNRHSKNPNFNPDEPENEETNPKFILTPGDSWTIGFTPHLITGVWVGNNRGKPMKAGATGMAVAAPIWKKFMTNAHEILFRKGADKDKLYNEPIPLTPKTINKFSGKLIKDDTPEHLRKIEYFSSDNLPTELDDSVKIIDIDKISGRPATEHTPAFAKIQKQVLDIKSIRPDLPNWQNPVDDWLRHHSKFLSSLGVIWDEVEEEEFIEEIPDKKEFFNHFRRRNNDDVHNRFTQNNPPKLNIISPKNNGNIAIGSVNVKISAQAKFGIKLVEFYFDDQLVDESYKAPFSGKFTVPNTTKIGSSHTIRVIAIDKLLNYTEKNITIKVANDKNGPNIKFLGPVGNQKIPLNSEIQILADIQDDESDISSVEFLLDDESLGKTNTPPYQIKFTAKSKLGRHFLKIKATDLHRNTSEKSLPVIFERERLVTQSVPSITKIIKYRNSTSIDMIFPSPKKIEYTIFTVQQRKRIVYSEQWTDLPRFKQIQLSHDLINGNVEIFLETKFKGEEKTIKTAKKKIQF